jgi:alkylation response protein AidB-like acyl-CoA dehydrogenase
MPSEVGGAVAFLPTPEQAAAGARAGADAVEICLPGAADRDVRRAFPGQELKELGRRGWFGAKLAVDAGGLGLDEIGIGLAIAEFSRSCASIGMLLGFHNVVFLDALVRLASEEARSRWLPAVARGEALGAIAIADPSVVDPCAPAAEALREGDRIRLHGVKAFVPGAAGADVFLVYAFADAGGRAPRPRILLLVPRDTPGLTVDASDPLVGVRASGTATVRFDGCDLPAAAVLSGDGRALGRELLAAADLVVAAQAVGIATAAVERAAGRANERDSTGALVGSHQGVQFMIADMLTSLDASRLFLHRAGGARMRGGSFAYEAAQAKAHASRAAVRIADAAIQILGGAGSRTDYGIERHWRDAKTTELNPATREAALLLVARWLLEETR